MHKFLLLFLTVITFAQTFRIKPEFSYEYVSDNESYIIEGLESQDYEFTFIGEFKQDKLNILTRMGYHFIDGMVDSPSDFTRQQGLHWVENPPGIGDDQRNYYVADMKLEYGDSSNYYYFNKWDKHWGPGVNSLTISKNIPRFFHFGFKWKLKENLRFEYFHGKLKSGVGNSIFSHYYSDLDGRFTRTFDTIRNIVGHRIEWQPMQQVIVSGSELVIYANRSIEFTYLLPFVPFFPIQTYIGETDNVIMSGDIQYIPLDNIRFFGVFLMDEWAPPYTFDEDNRNWFGWQTGMELINIGFPHSSLHMEYTWTDHRIYRHRFQINDFYSWGYPVGFWAGPHAEEIYFDYHFNLGDNHVEIMLSEAKRGMLTDSLLIDQYDRPNKNKPIYERFSNGIEEKQVLLLSVYRNITDQLSIKLSYTYTDWKNAGFDPEYPLSYGELPDIKKHSLGFAFRYIY